MIPKGRVRRAVAAAALLASGGLVAIAGNVRADGAATPRAPANAPADDFVGRVRTAVAEHDINLFDKSLVDWDGARMRTHRLTLFLIRECFGRPVKSIAIEPLPKEDPAEPLIPDGYKTNLPITNLLRIAFDEAHPPSETPACVFFLSKDRASAYRIVLVLPSAPHPP